MASGTKTKAKKHKCSCGRSFRHAISLKRHQNVTGCEAAPIEEAADVSEATPDADKVAAKSPKAKAKKSKSKPAKPAPVVEDDRTIVITPELVAAWQQQTGFNRRPTSVVDTIAPPPAKAEVDWVALAQTGKEFVEFCGEVKSATVSGVKGFLLLVSRAVLLCAVVSFAGWCLVSGVSASVTVDNSSDSGRTQLAAQTLVQDFLQNAKLNQYDRARSLLAPGARESVSKNQLQLMLNSLPLNHTPSAWNTELSSDGLTARVIVSRDGLNEVYTVVRSDAGWGLASVAIANS